MNINVCNNLTQVSTPNKICFKANDNTSKDNVSRYLVGGTVTAAALVFAYKKGEKKELEKVLKKNGIVLQNGIAKKIESEELFTGFIKRNVKHFGLKTETSKYVNGELREQLYHDLFGRELKGLFYKNGKLKEEVTVDSNIKKKNKAFMAYQYSDNGNLIKSSDGFVPKTESIFEIYRKKYN